MLVILSQMASKAFAIMSVNIKTKVQLLFVNVPIYILVVDVKTVEIRKIAK